VRRKPKVVKLKTRIDSDRESAIETLEMILKMARAGDITEVAIAYVRPNSSINCCVSENTIGNAGLILGAVVMLQHRLTNLLDEDDGEG
jgi:hypothetical protein